MLYDSCYNQGMKNYDLDDGYEFDHPLVQEMDDEMLGMVVDDERPPKRIARKQSTGAGIGGMSGLGTPKPASKIASTLSTISPSPVTPVRAAFSLLSDPTAVAEKFFAKKEIDPLELATHLVQYFGRIADGFYEEVVFNPRSETSETILRPFHLPIPQLTEFARSQGLTMSELKWIGREYPHTVGRALEMARDTVREYLVRKGLDGSYNAQFAQLIAVNETELRAKSEVTERRIDMNKLVDQLEQATKPNSINPETIYDSNSRG